MHYKRPRRGGHPATRTRNDTAMPEHAINRTPQHTLRTQLVGKILQTIFSGAIRGGERLIEEELGARFGVSRTPIREALSELAAIGLIRLQPNQGAVVRPFGPAPLLEIYHVRRILEVEATRMACGRVNPGALQEVLARTHGLIAQADHTKQWEETALALDEEFHQLISRGSGSERLAEEIGKYRTLVVAVGDAVGNALHAHDQNLQEHASIIDHLLQGRADEAAAAMGKHIDRGAQTAAKAIEMIYSTEAPRGA